jgi:iron complex transport system substrate-binding protein
MRWYFSETRSGERSFMGKAILKRSTFVLLASVMIVLYALPSYVHGMPGDKAVISVTDFRGKTISFKKPVNRIICLIESALSGLYMLGVADKVVGISANIYSGNVFPYYAELDKRIRTRRLPAPGNWDFVNIESVISLKPDLVIIWAHQTESIRVLEERGIPVFGVFIEKKEDVYSEIATFGKLTGREKRAEQLIQYTKKEIDRIEKEIKAIPDSRRPSVYYMWAQGNLETSCGGSTVNDLITLAGGKNVCSHIPREHVVISMENLLSWKPDIIVMWYNEKKDPLHILRDPQLLTIKAVKEGKVYEFDDVFHSDLWTLKFQHAARIVAKWCHPEAFRNMDLEGEKKKMWNALYGIDTDMLTGRKP